MDAQKELRDWVDTLESAEKRHISLLGGARGGGSQHLELWKWLLASSAEDEVPEPLRRQLPTHLQRLKAQVLDSLRLLDQQATPDSRMSAGLAAFESLQMRGLTASAWRQLQRVISQAWQSCRYEVVVQSITAVRRAGLAPEVTGLDAAAWRAEERKALASLALLCRLRGHYDELLSLVGNAFSRRNTALEAKFAELAGEEDFPGIAKASSWLERSLADNMMGIKQIYRRDFVNAYHRYADLVREWSAHPDWQLQEPALFLNLCKNYQTACFWQPQQEGLAARLALLPDMAHLPKAMALGHQLLLRRGQVAHLMTTADFALLPVIRPELLSWLDENWDALGVSKSLVLLFNLAAITFMAEDHRSCLGMVRMILQRGKKSKRTDLRSYCLVLEAILHHELGNGELNEYLIRAARRRFSRTPHQDRFEQVVLQCLSQLGRTLSPRMQSKRWAELEADLMGIRESLDTPLQLPGLTETLIWAKARRQGRPLRQVYVEMMGENEG